MVCVAGHVGRERALDKFGLKILSRCIESVQKLVWRFMPVGLPVTAR